jgi:hypothetical protein
VKKWYIHFFDLIKFEYIQVSLRKKATVTDHFDVGKISPIFKLVSFLHKDKINENIFARVRPTSSTVILILKIFRCTICFVRRSRRIELSLI